ncbi:MAG TPA: hypothetical protein PLO56_05860 [Rhodothermales bacterium]|nr:hypothetical protein [Rhodothermales bacterium]
MKHFYLLIFLFLFTLSTQAQPSDAEIRAKLTDANTLSVKLVGTGVRSWNDAFGNWEWRRGAEVLKKSTQYGGLKVMLYGTAIYQYTGAGKYAWKQFYVGQTKYDGLPDPNEDEIMAFINADRAKFFGYYYGKIVALKEGPTLIPEFNWETPMRVVFKMKVVSEQIASNTKLETVEQLYEVRFYRDEMTQPWQRMISSFGERKILSSRELNAEEVRRMPTLAVIEANRQINERMLNLPQITIPAFKDANEAATFVYRQIREGTPESVEAVLRKMMGSYYYQNGSTTLLNGQGEETLQRVIEKAFKGIHKFNNQYCANPVVDVNRTRSSRNRVYFMGVVNNLASQIAFEVQGGKYVDGVKTDQEWKITDIQIYLRDDQEVRDFINSFSDWKKLCPNDK